MLRKLFTLIVRALVKGIEANLAEVTQYADNNQLRDPERQAIRDEIERRRGLLAEARSVLDALERGDMEDVRRIVAASKLGK